MEQHTKVYCILHYVCMYAYSTGLYDELESFCSDLLTVGVFSQPPFEAHGIQVGLALRMILPYRHSDGHEGRKYMHLYVHTYIHTVVSYLDISTSAAHGCDSDSQLQPDIASRLGPRLLIWDRELRSDL